MSQSIGFIGLGNMGLGMAANLVRAGARVQAFDLSSTAVEKARLAGCAIATSASEAATDVDLVITMLPAAAQVSEVWRNALIPKVRTGALLIDCSTIDVDSARQLAREASEVGLFAADAPVSGGVAGAETGSLAFMVGCPELLFERVKSSLEPMARVITYAGDAGAGQAAKICNNMLLGISMIGVGEAFALAERLGLEPARFFEIASNSSGQCWSLTSYCPWPGLAPSAPSNRGYEGGFLTSLMSKDLKLAQQAAAKVGAATPLGAQAQAIYALFETLGYGHKDFSALMQLLRGRAGDL